MKIPVEPIAQYEGTDCFITCVEMILKFYGEYASREQIKLFVKKDKDGTPLTEYASFLNSMGLNVYCFGYNLQFMSPADKELSQEKLLAKLEEEQKHPWMNKDYNIDISSIIDPIKSGVTYYLEPPSLKLIKSYLKQKIPLIISVNPLVLNKYQAYNTFAGHAVVAVGFSKNLIHFIDPDQGVERSMPEEEFMLTIFARKFINTVGWAIATKPGQFSYKELK